ncbi:hypothetical protein OG937_22265 [Streptomyces sp. NBC_00510]
MTSTDTVFELALRRRGGGFHFYYGTPGLGLALLCLITVVAVVIWWQVTKRRDGR